MAAVDHSYKWRRVAGVRALAITAAAVLAGCEGTVSVDMDTNAPADPQVVQVLVDLAGVEFVDDGGSTESLTFDEPLRLNLVEFTNGNLFRLLTDEQLPDGRYTSVRLLIESDEDGDEDVVIAESGEQFPLSVNGTATSEVDFTVDKDDSSRESIVLTLDLRQSLSFNDDPEPDEFTLAPVMRGVRVEDAGQLVGNVTASCPSGQSLAEGGAVYLFAGEDITPDDRDGSDPEPYLTSGVGTDVSASTAGYSFAYVPEGDYTVALTCRGNLEDASTDDDLDFRNISNVSIEAESTVTHDIE